MTRHLTLHQLAEEAYPFLDKAETIVLLDSLNVRALDRQMEEYGEGAGDAAADLFIKLTGRDPHEHFSRWEAMSTEQREQWLREEAADKLRANEWFGPAEEVVFGTSIQTIITRVEEMTEDEDERDRAIPILGDLELALDQAARE